MLAQNVHYCNADKLVQHFAGDHQPSLRDMI